MRGMQRMFQRSAAPQSAAATAICISTAVALPLTVPAPVAASSPSVAPIHRRHMHQSAAHLREQSNKQGHRDGRGQSRTRRVWRAVGASAGLLVGSAICVASCAPASSSHDDDHHKHSVATKTWHYYSGPGGNLENLRLFAGNSNPGLAEEIAHYLGVDVSKATVGRFSDGEIKIQVHENVRQTHCFVVQPTSSPVNDNLMELLLLVSTLRRASAAEITVVIPYYGYERADRKLSSRVPISAADVALMLEEMGVDRVVSVDLHGGQIQGFFSPSVPVENLDSMPIGALYFSEKRLRKPVIVAASAGGVLRAKRFRETLLEQRIDSDLAMLIESREVDEAGRFPSDSKGQLDLVGQVDGCDCIVVEDIVDTASTICHAADELKRQGARKIYGFTTHGLFSAQDAAQKIEAAPIKELVTTNTVRMQPAIERVDKVTQLTLAPLLAECIRRIYQQRSISGLYQHPISAPASESVAQRTA